MLAYPSSHNRFGTSASSGDAHAAAAVLIISRSAERASRLRAQLAHQGFRLGFIANLDRGLVIARDCGMALILVDVTDVDGEGLRVI
jgi:DNA-binding response OmpR family regulator